MIRNSNLKKKLNENIQVIRKLENQNKSINQSIKLIIDTLKKKNKIFICGNGGSASQAEHFSTEFLVRLNKKINREPIPIIPLAFNNSHISACSNDYSFKIIFSKTLKAVGNKGDCLIVLSTSGRSKNIIEVLKVSKKMKINSIGFFGPKKKIEKKADINLCIEDYETARIQEAHLFLGHYILNEVEKIYLKLNKK